MNVWIEGGVKDIDRCKIIEQLRSLDCDVAKLDYMANQLFALCGRLIRLQETIWAKDTGEAQSEESITRVASDYEKDMDYVKSPHSHYFIDKATFLEVCRKIYDQKGGV